jgi:TPR repeat protein
MRRLERLAALTLALLSLEGCGSGDAAGRLAAELAQGKAALAAQPADPVAAQRLWLQAAQQGSAAAAYHLALLLRRGDAGVPADPTQAERWMRQAARAGLPDAEFMLGQLLVAGAGARPAEARQWLERAAEHDHPEANLALALAARHGELGFTPGSPEAERFLMEAEHALKHRPPAP